MVVINKTNPSSMRDIYLSHLNLVIWPKYAPPPPPPKKKKKKSVPSTEITDIFTARTLMIILLEENLLVSCVAVIWVVKQCFLERRRVV